MVVSKLNDASLSAQIKDTRRKLGLSQAQAAAAWNVPLKTLQKWEQGIREPQGLALDALQQKLAEAMAGQGSAEAIPQAEPPETVIAPAAQSDDATLGTLARADPAPADSPDIGNPITAPPVDAPAPEAVAVDEDSRAHRYEQAMRRMRAERAAEQQRRADIHAFLGIEDNGSDWLPHLPPRETIARSRALEKAFPTPQADNQVGW